MFVKLDIELVHVSGETGSCSLQFDSAKEICLEGLREKLGIQDDLEIEILSFNQASNTYQRVKTSKDVEGLKNGSKLKLFRRGMSKRDLTQLKKEHEKLEKEQQKAKEKDEKEKEKLRKKEK